MGAPRSPDAHEDPAQKDGQRRRDWGAHREQVKASNRARYRAHQRLIAEKQERFDEIYAEECAVEGVTPRRALLAQKLERDIAKLKRRLDRIKEREAGGG